MNRDDLVTVGIPTYNAAATVRASLEAVLEQDHHALEILVADNASTDGTVAICREVAAGDPRVRIVVHEVNHGWQYNFRFLLAEATGPYFMWVGADDRPDPTFVSANVAALQANPSLVASVSLVRWVNKGHPAGLAAGTASLLGSPRQNVATYLRQARDNSRFYGVHRTAVLRDSFPSENFYGLDLAVMVGTLRHGGHAELPDVLLERERSNPADYVAHIDRDATGFLDRLLPLRGFSGAILLGLRAPMSPRAILWLSIRNIFEHFRYWSRSPNLYGRLARKVFLRLDEYIASVTRRDDEGIRPEPQ